MSIYFSVANFGEECNSVSSQNSSKSTIKSIMKSVSTANVPGYKNPGFKRNSFGGFRQRRGTSGRARSKARKRHADGSGPSQRALRKRAKRKAINAITKELDRERRYPYIKVADRSYYGHPAVWLRWEIDLVFRDGRLIHPRTIFLSGENSPFINSGFFGSSERTLHPTFFAGDNAAPDVFFAKPEKPSGHRNPWDY